MPQSSGNTLRTVIESERFSEEKTAFANDIKRFDKMMFGIDHVLARNPEIGEQTDNPDIWSIPINTWSSRTLLVYYSFDENQVVLESIVEFET